MTQDTRDGFVDEAQADRNVRAICQRQATRSEIVHNRNTLGAELLFGEANEFGGRDDESHGFFSLSWAGTIAAFMRRQ